MGGALDPRYGIVPKTLIPVPIAGKSVRTNFVADEGFMDPPENCNVAVNPALFASDVVLSNSAELPANLQPAEYTTEGS